MWGFRVYGLGLSGARVRGLRAYDLRVSAIEGLCRDPDSRSTTDSIQKKQRQQRWSRSNDDCNHILNSKR